VIHCQNCGSEVEEGRSFCPNCGKPVVADAGAAQSAVAPASPDVIPMPSFGRSREEGDKSRLVIYGAVAVVSLLLVAGLAYWATRPASGNRPGEERLEGAIRPGSPDFPANGKLIVDFDPDENATIGVTGLGTYAVRMAPTVRNFTGRTVGGLEFHAAGLDLQGKVIRERTFVSNDDIEPNKIATPAISLNFPADNKPAQLKLELTGVRFK
jgi:hypothetical protein